MAKKPITVTDVDLAAVAVEEAGGGSESDIVDVAAIPQPVPLSELTIHAGIVEGSADIDPTDEDGISTILGKSAAAMAASEASDAALVPDDGEFVKVFYHPATRKYVQFNQALVGRSDFRLQRVKKADFHKLNVSA